MPIFAIHNGSEVVNVIVADTIELAEQVTGMDAIESVDGVPSIGWLLVDGEWSAPVIQQPETDEATMQEESS